METFGKLLKQLRLESKVTQEYLSENIGYSRKQIIRVENDQQLPSLELLYNLSVFYNIDLIQYQYFIHNNIEVDTYIKNVELLEVINNYSEYENEKLDEIFNDEINEDSPYIKLLEIIILYKKMSPANIKRALSLCEEMILEDSQVSELLDFTKKRTLNKLTYNFANTYVALRFMQDKEDGYELACKLEEVLYDIINRKCNMIFHTPKDILITYCVLLLNKSEMCFEMNNLDEAIHCCERAHKILVKNNISTLMNVVLEIKVRLYYEKREFEQAKRIYEMYLGFIAIYNKSNILEKNYSSIVNGLSDEKL